MVYNKDKDLVFVYKPDGFWNEREYVYEVHHMEQMVPYAVKAIENHSLMKDDGIITVYDMNTRDNLKFYGEDKYWNLDLKDEFMASTRGLWKGNFDCKRRGSIFHLDFAPASDEEALTVSKVINHQYFVLFQTMKVDRELQDAVAKHGEAVVPRKYEEEF